MTFDYPMAGALFYRWKNHCCYASSPRSQAFVRQRSGTQHRRDGCICSLPTGRYFNINFFCNQVQSLLLLVFNEQCVQVSKQFALRFNCQLLSNQILVFQMPSDSKFLCQLLLPNCIFFSETTVYPLTFLWQLKILTRPYGLLQFCQSYSCLFISKLHSK